MSAGQRSVFGDQPPVAQPDLPPHEFEMVLLSAKGGHRIADKSNVAPAFRGKGGAHHKRIDMDTIHNDAHCEAFVSKGHANDTRLPSTHGRHCIEEVGNATEPLVDRPYQGLGSCL